MLFDEETQKIDPLSIYTLWHAKETQYIFLVFKRFLENNFIHIMIVTIGMKSNQKYTPPFSYMLYYLILIIFFYWSKFRNFARKHIFSSVTKLNVLIFYTRQGRKSIGFNLLTHFERSPFSLGMDSSSYVTLVIYSNVTTASCERRYPSNMMLSKFKVC